MKLIKIHLIIISFLLLCLGFSHINAATYAVIVNIENKQIGEVKEFKTIARRMFLKQQLAWDNHVRVRAYYPDGIAFTALQKSILGFEREGELSQYWLREKQLEGNVPPRTINSSRLMVRLVGRHAGAIGVVPKGNSLKLDGVRVWFTFSD